MLTKMENRILYRFDNEQVMIEPWGLDALRVRATCAASFTDGEDHALLPAASVPVQISIDEKGASIINGHIRCDIDRFGVMTFLRDGKPILREYERNRYAPTDRPLCSALEIRPRMYAPHTLSLIHIFTAAIVAGTVTLLYRLIYKPIRLFAEEVETICDGDLTPSSQSFGIREFDELFTKIEEMKRAITLLMDNARYAEKEKRHLQLDNLYYQINPHFLLNALNSLHWLAMMSNQQDIVQYVHQLNSILSYSLGKTTGIITLRTELRVADDYVKLQQMRYDFNFSMDVEEGAYLDTPCARLILQPVLENAICHNMNEFGSLLLEVHPHDDGHVCIRIRDDGAGMKTLPSEGLLLRDVSDSGIGFKYLQGTLDAYYGQAANVLIRPGSEGGVCVEMLLPLL